METKRKYVRKPRHVLTLEQINNIKDYYEKGFSTRAILDKLELNVPIEIISRAAKDNYGLSYALHVECMKQVD